MPIDKKFLNLFVKATEKAAIGASKFIGKKDKIAADKGAVDPMRRELNKINMEGTVVIGEGEMDEAPMLYIGEKLGTLNGPKFDIAVDPLEGTKFTANGQGNAFSVIAITEKAFPCPLAVNFVPSSGSTAISNLGPFKVPNFSPIYNIGASSISPSPITTVPSMLILFSSLLIGSTAPLSAAILSFFPINFDAPIAAFSVAFTNKFKNFLSIGIY